jgi:hypothetical protein
MNARLEALQAVLGAGATFVDPDGGPRYIVITDKGAHESAVLHIKARPSTAGIDFISDRTGFSRATIAEIVNSGPIADGILAKMIESTCGFATFAVQAINAFGVERFLGAKLVGRHGEYGVYRVYELM